MKIPFDIKYRPQIESGEYKVETRDGKPARIVCWDRKSIFNQKLLVLVYNGNAEVANNYREDGVSLKSKETIWDLFIVTPEEEPELSEFEKKLSDVVGYAISLSVAEPKKPTSEFVKEYAAELLALAKKEIMDGWSNGLRDTQDQSGKAYSDGYKLGHENGKSDALKDLPRWGPNDVYPELNDVVIGSIGTDEHFFIHRGRIIHLESLEKLPGFND